MFLNDNGLHKITLTHGVVPSNVTTAITQRRIECNKHRVHYKTTRCYWRPSIGIGLAVLCFYSKTGFWPSYWTNLDKIVHTPIVVRNTLVGLLRPRSARARLQAKPERPCFFSVILVTHQVLYRDDGTPRFRRQTAGEVRTGAIVKNSGIL